MEYTNKLEARDLLEMYRLLILTREFEDRLCGLWGRGGVVELPHGSQGQEAIAIGACYGLRVQDQVLPSLRTRGAFIVKGVPTTLQMAGIFGKVGGPARGKSTTHHMTDPVRGVLLGTGLIGSDIPVAVGAALAFKLQKKESIVVNFFGDGAAQRGDFHEGLNFAAVFKLPVMPNTPLLINILPEPTLHVALKAMVSPAYGWMATTCWQFTRLSRLPQRVHVQAKGLHYLNA